MKSVFLGNSAALLVVTLCHVSFVRAATCVPAVWPAEKEAWTWHEDAGEGPGIHRTTDIVFHDGTWYSVGTQRDYQRCAHLWEQGEEIFVSLATSADGLFDFVVEDSIRAVDAIGDRAITYGDNRNVFFPCFGKNPDGTPATHNGRFVLMVISETADHQTIHQCLFSDDMKHWTDRTIVEPLSSFDEPVNTDPVREPQSFILDDDGTWYVYYVSHTGDRGDAQIKFASGPSPVELTPNAFEFRDGRYESLDPVVIRDSQSWIVLYNSERADNRYVRIDSLGDTDWGEREEYFKAVIQAPATTFAWAAVVNEAEETVTWRLYQTTMTWYSPVKVVHSGAWKTTVALDNTVNTRHHTPRSEPGTAFSIRGGTRGNSIGNADRGPVYNCLGRVVIGGTRADDAANVLNYQRSLGLRLFTIERPGKRSCVPGIVIDGNVKR